MPAAGTTTSTVGTASTTTTTDLVPPGATTASTGNPLFRIRSGLGAQALPRTGQGLSGPLSLAVVSIFFGALLLLGQRRGGVLAMAAPQPAALRQPMRHTAVRINAPTVIEGPRPGVQVAPGASPPPVGPVGSRGPKSGDMMEAMERQLHQADARLKAVYNNRDWVSGTPDSANSN